MWGGHFSRGPADAMQAINPSISVDRHLYRQDITGSRAHAAMLAACGIISKTDHEAILGGLKQIEQEISEGRFTFTDALEDIHMHVENRLAELIGDTAGRLHTARSRNDQVITDVRLFTREACANITSSTRRLQRALYTRADEHAETIMPGFTHLQPAQPVTLGHHLLAYMEMLARDAGRFADCSKRLNECPLGAAALAGTSFPIDRDMTAKTLGFTKPMGNSLDAVASRDFAVEFLAAGAILATHLSRLCEELINWSTPMWRFITLSEAFTTGSSIMPQKRNPDAAELVRGKTARITGSLMQMLTLLKSLPLAYNKDLQEDKEALLDVAHQLPLCLAAVEGMIADMQVHKERMHAAASSGYSTATDLADWLVQTLGIPFRQAHHITGKIVNIAEGKNIRLDELSLSDMQSIEPGITQDVFNRLSVEQSVASRMSYGGTAPYRIREQLRRWKRELDL
jgi:argininosuccinate lyase